MSIVKTGALAAVAGVMTLTMLAPQAQARDGQNAAFVGGLIAGGIVGATVSNAGYYNDPPRYYAPPPVYYYRPPVYRYAPPPPPPPPVYYYGYRPYPRGVYVTGPRWGYGPPRFDYHRPPYGWGHPPRPVPYGY